MLDNEREKATAANNRSLVMRAAGLVGAAMLVSRLLGLVRDIVIKNYLGVTTMEALAFDTAVRFPETIYVVVAGGAVGSAFIPTFAAYFARDDEAGAWHLFSAVINLLLVVVVVIAGLTAVFAPEFVRFFLNTQINETPGLLPLTVRLMRILLLSPVIFSASGLFMAALNARQHFLLPALAPIIYNLGIIAGAIVADWTNQPIEIGLAVGTVAGSLGHLLIQLPGLRQKRAVYTAVFTVRDAGVRQVLRLMAPRVLGLSFSEINAFVALFLSDMMPLGSFPALNTARRIMIMPQGILGQAMGIAAFPTLADLASRQDWPGMREILSDSLRMLFFLGVPATVFLVVLREPIIVILYQRGIFGVEDATLVTWALLFYAFGLVALTFIEIIARTFYALSDTTTPVVAGFVQIVLMTLLSVGLIDVFEARGWLALGGVALGFSLSNYMEVAVLLWLLRRKLGGLKGRALLDGLWRTTVAGAGMTVAAMFIVRSVENVWLQALLGGLGGGAIFLLLALTLRIPELAQIWEYGRRRLKR